MAGGQILAFPIDFDRRPYNTLALPCECVIQGSAIGPTSYVVTASDLHAICHGNELCKYADDTYLIIPAVKLSTSIPDPTISGI